MTFCTYELYRGKQESEENLIITDSRIGMDSARTYTSVSMDAYSRSRSVESISVKDFMDSLSCALNNVENDSNDNDKEVSNEDKESDGALLNNSEDSLEFLKSKFSDISAAKITKASKLEEDLRSAIRYLCLNFLLMLILGKNAGAKEAGSLSESLGLGSLSAGDSGLGGINTLSGTNLQFSKVTDSVTVSHYEGEFEGTTFNAKGIVRTSDGKEIDFGIDLTMSRSFEQYVSLSERTESFNMMLMDPLVINLDSSVAEVSDQKFYFDLDADGIEDEITTLSSNSGFLALDLNEDGTINDGSELFGTKSGDGFKDLSAYDNDGNGWIDEADEVFDKLKIFCINEDGTTSQYSLKEKGVGALYLGNKETEFSVRNLENSVNAQIRKTGLFLYENGSVGTLQHVDLAVELGA